MNKKNVFYWALYDFAHSIVISVFFLYFSQWLVIDRHVSDFWFNMLFVGSSILLIGTSPIAGLISDKLHVRIPFIRFSTILFAVFFGLTSYFADFSESATVIACVFFLLANYLYQFQFTFYNALLYEIAPPHKQGLVSGIGQCANWSGQIAGLILGILVVGGTIAFWGLPGRAHAFLPATIVAFVLSIPLIFFFKEPRREAAVKVDVWHEYKHFFHSFRELLRSPGMARFLLGYFLFNDAVVTATNNFPIYLEKVFGVTDSDKSILLVSILAASAFGALLCGWISDKVGLKRSLLWILIGWSVIFPSMGLMTNYKIFFAASIVMGLLYGSIWTVTRAVMSYLSPPEKLNHAFSYYTLAERFSTFTGPLAWGLTTMLLRSLGPEKYRIALTVMGVFIFFGLLIVWKIPHKSPHHLKEELMLDVYSGL